jgi:hypothetical protein
MAWLSTASASPSTRFTQSTVPYYLPSGVKIADNWTDLTDGTLDAVINTNELGVVMPPNTPYTGTNANGTAGAVHCNGWTSSSAAVTGVMGATTIAAYPWSANQNRACNTQARVFCFQQ